MHVFCPDCNAEYKVSERSSLTKTVKFVCIECGNSWVDKFEKLEQNKSVASGSKVSIGSDITGNTNNEMGTTELNFLAFEEVQNSFGDHKNKIEPESNDTGVEHTFQFETSEVRDEISDEGPSKTFPKIRGNKETPSDHQIEERDAKEIEIEKRLKESSELLKKAKQPHVENKETMQKERKPKSQKVLITLSILLIVSFFIYNLTILFLEEIVRKVPFLLEISSQINLYTSILKDLLFIIVETIINFYSQFGITSLSNISS